MWFSAWHFQCGLVAATVAKVLQPSLHLVITYYGANNGSVGLELTGSGDLVEIQILLATVQKLWADW
jgi:hypothetical protein